ncbi:MAG: phosphoribosylglycinamide formyltransferase [Proteobacteria bacterium]|uniref:phosphoribosylglycinamide formyltransferase n=1 Tax=Rudaea sp. TaxID=2136325 RepID=UPI00322017C2|nr:phosphoribosylglycinamide formyltransferase [Pseudomonadota bacterium]
MALFSLAVLCSGRGSNLQALIDATSTGTLPARIAAVCSDKPNCTALTRARQAGIATRSLRQRDFPDRAAFDRALFADAAQFAPDLIVLAGYMRIIDPAVVAQWQGRMINIHPSLLPKYPGLRTHQRAIDAGDAEHGASVHYVSAELDGGPVIAQAALPVVAGDTAETLAARLLPLEHHLLVATARLIATGDIALEGGRVVRDGRPLPAPLRLAVDGKLVAA